MFAAGEGIGDGGADVTALAIFLACFIVVFALGLQSLNVNGGHKWLAALTSFVIGASQLYLLKAMPQPTGWLENAAYLSAGPLAIVCSMAAHPWLVRWMRRRT
jgi:uncharacterized membrane protein